MKYKKLHDAAQLFDDLVKSRKKNLPTSAWIQAYFIRTLRREVHYLGRGGFKRAFLVKANKRYFVLKVAPPDIISREWNTMQMARASDSRLRARTARYYWKTDYCLIQRYLPMKATKDRCQSIRSIAKRLGFWNITPRNTGATKTGIPKIFDLEPPRIRISLKSSPRTDWEFLKKFGPREIDWFHAIDNLRRAPQFNDTIREWATREWFVRSLSYAVPSEVAILKIKEFANGSPILEVGAGLGLWAMLLQKAGVRVTPTDISPEVSKSRYHYCDKRQPSYTPVMDMDNVDAIEAYGATHPVLMFCWPPYATEMATDALSIFKGDRVIYIGERGGCTADSEFEDLLEKEWTEVEDFRIPKWFGIHDKMRLFTRKLAV